MRRLIATTLLLYPRAIRRGHGAELESLVEELIERDGASRPAVMTRLAADGIAQRFTSRATAWAVAITLLVTSAGGLAVSDFAAASAHQRIPATVLRPDGASHPRGKLTRRSDPRAHRSYHRSPGIIEP